jgi:nitrile hydratase
VRDIDPVGHTHLPLYLRGKSGVIERDHGIFIVPDSGGNGWSEKLQHVYSVRFVAREIWGSEASDRNSMNFNLWDSYMDAA